MPQNNSVSKALDKINNSAATHPLSNIIDAPLIDPILQGDMTISGDVVPGSYVDKKNKNLGLEDVQGTAGFFSKGIAGGLGGAALGGAGASGEFVGAGADLEAASTGAASAGGGGGGGSAAGGQLAQAASLQSAGGTETLGATSSQMPPATPEPAGGPTAAGGSAAPNATMPAAIPEPAGGPTAPGGSAAEQASAPPKQPASQDEQSKQPANKTPTTTKTVLDSVKTASQILGAAAPLLYAAAGASKAKQQASQQQAPPPPPPPPTLPVFGSGKGPLSAPIVERSIIHDQAARRGRQSTILTNDQNDRLGG